MRKLPVVVLLCLLFAGCSGDDDNINNPYLVNLNVSFQLNLDLPQYNGLNFPGNYFVHPNYGINGVVIYNLNNSQYTAYELTDPNHAPTSCSTLEVDGIEAYCGCDDGNGYSIVTGQLISGSGEYSLKAYRVVRRGNILEITN